MGRKKSRVDTPRASPSAMVTGRGTEPSRGLGTQMDDLGVLLSSGDLL